MDEFVPDAPLKKKRDKEYCRSVNSTAKRRLFLNVTEEKFETFILERLYDFIKNLESSLDIFCIFVAGADWPVTIEERGGYCRQPTQTCRSNR